MRLGATTPLRALLGPLDRDRQPAARTELQPSPARRLDDHVSIGVDVDPELGTVVEHEVRVRRRSRKRCSNDGSAPAVTDAWSAAAWAVTASAQLADRVAAFQESVSSLD